MKPFPRYERKPAAKAHGLKIYSRGGRRGTLLASRVASFATGGSSLRTVNSIARKLDASSA